MNNDHKESYVEKQLADALITLLQKQDIDDISIRSLCLQADVGRASFYRHFQSKEEILDQHAAALIKIWAEEFEADPQSHPSNVFESLFTHIQKHQTFYKVLYKTKRVDVIRNSLRQKIGYSKDLNNAEAYQKVFFADGLSGYIEEWIERGMQESPSELNKLLGEYFTDTLSRLYLLFQE